MPGTLELSAAVDGGMPDVVPVGRGACLLLEGSCSISQRRPRSVRLVIDGKRQVPAGVLSAAAPGGPARWWAMGDLPGTLHPRTALVELEALVGWRKEPIRRTLGVIGLIRGWEAPQLDFKAAADRADGSITGALPLQPKVAICLATRPTNAGLFSDRLASLRRQTHQNWFCVVYDTGSSREDLDEMKRVIGDSSRIVLIEGAESDRCRSFEAALNRVPADAPYIALVDDDEPWPAHALDSLLASLTPECNAVLGGLTESAEGDRGNRPVGARPRGVSIADMASSRQTVRGPLLFRRQLLDYVVPFPVAAQPSSRPEKWIALVARAVGGIAYRQDLGNGERDVASLSGAVTGDASVPQVSDRLRAQLGVTAAGRVLQARCGEFLTGNDRRALKRVVSAAG